jgi:hypothetical protein
MYQVRKIERYTVLRHTDTANLDPEKFRTVGYDGDNEQDFLAFIENLDYSEVYDMLDKETRNQLSLIKEDYNWNEFYNTAWDYDDYWFESGVEDIDESQRSGYFDTRFTTNKD